MKNNMYAVWLFLYLLLQLAIKNIRILDILAFIVLSNKQTKSQLIYQITLPFNWSIVVI